jgi:outer membrane immunogenic protein
MYSWADDKDTSRSALQPGIALTAEMKNLLLVTGKLGFAYENFLAYAKGGWASADVDFRSTLLCNCVLATSSSGRENGWTAGLGLDYALGPNISIGIEYDYVRLNVGARDQIAGPAGVAGNQVTDGGLDMQSVLARLNFKLGPRPNDEPGGLK